MTFSRRKWGYFLTLWSAKAFKVKLLWFKAGAACSMQKHFKRNELWLFIFGQGDMGIGAEPFNFHPENVYDMRQGDFVEVLKERWHCFRARRTTLILEIQTGECREDDIERVV